MELWLCVRDTQTPNRKEYVNRPQKGDVVMIVPDGHPWGKEEVKHPNFVVVQLPELHRAALDDLLEPNVDKYGTRRYYRARHIDIEAVPPLVAALSTGRVIRMTGEDANLFCRAKRVKDERFFVVS